MDTRAYNAFQATKQSNSNPWYAEWEKYISTSILSLINLINLDNLKGSGALMHITQATDKDQPTWHLTLSYQIFLFIFTILYCPLIAKLRPKTNLKLS